MIMSTDPGARLGMTRMSSHNVSTFRMPRAAQLSGVWGQVSHFPFSRGIVWRGGLPVNLPHANASTVVAIRDAKAGKVNCKELEGSRRW
jgi:hypothetical protein